MKLTDIRRAGVPLAFFESSDPEATQADLIRQGNGKGKELILLRFDVVRGMHSLNELGDEWIAANGPQEGFTFTVVDWFNQFTSFGGKAVSKMKGLLFWHEPEWQEIIIRQGVSNLRDTFKQFGWTWIGIGLSANLPPNMTKNVIVVPEVLPNVKELGELLDETIDNVKQSGAEISLQDGERDQVCKAMLGLNRYAAETALALNVSPKGINIPGVWQCKLATIKQTQGCEVKIDNPRFNAIRGLNNVKSFLSDCVNSPREKPGCILFIDEIEKVLDASDSGEGKPSGGNPVISGLKGQFLIYTQERKIDGILLTGVPGAGKSAISQCAAGEAGIPFFKFSFSEIQNSLVGQSEANMKSAFTQLDAISQGKILMIATCNNMGGLSPEVIGRFRLGKFFFDYPDEEELASIVAYYREMYSLESEFPAVRQKWVGREIESACYMAWKFQKPLEEVVANVVPESISQKTKLEAIRNAASGRYLSASYPGVFQADRALEVKATRAFNL